MSPEKEAELQRLCPVFLKDLNGDPMQTCMSWGIACGDGWYEPIKKMCLQLEVLNKESEEGKIIAAQIKEKFGGLRCYVDVIPMDASNADELYRKAREIILAAENACEETCSVCGCKVKENTSRWTVICKDCKEKQKEWNEGPKDSDPSQCMGK